jgi:alpha-beta hydrolase superfamily lysophospholipase
MTSTPTWFGPAGRPLFGFFHVPDDGRARGTVVVCGPLGREWSNALPAVQSLADQLTTAGLAVLRFSYPGTGDSAGGLGEPDRLSDWLAGIDEAVSFARQACSGPVVVVAMRMGALLALEAVDRGTAVDHLVLWDPCTSGREYLRIEKALLATGYGAVQVGDGSVAGPAFTFSPQTVEDLTRLKLATADFSKVDRVLVAMRSEGRRVSMAGDAPSAGVEWIEVDGQPDLLDVPPQLITVPDITIKTIADWVTRTVDGPPAPVRFEPVASAEVARDRHGGAITERAEWLGPNSLFAVVTEPADVDGAEPEAAPPTVVFLSAGALDHTGAGRMWVELARRFAAVGLRCVRVDIDGVGESFGRPDLPRRVPKPPEALDDLADLAVALGDRDGRNLILVGLSSGGYHAIEAGLVLHPQGVCAVNPGLTGWVPDLDLGKIDRRRKAYRPMPASLRVLAVKHSRMATWSWQALCQVWVKGSPIHPVAGVARRGIPVLVIVSEMDVEEFEPSAYWALVRRGLRRRTMLDIEVVPGNDHSLYTVDGRADAYPILTRWIESRFARPVPVGAPVVTAQR